MELINQSDEKDNRIDQGKLKLYLATLSPENQTIVKTIVENTIYINFDYMLKLLLAALDKFELIHSKYNLYIDLNVKISSEHWIVTLLAHRLNPIRCFYGDVPINNDFPILIIDDAIYSSYHMCGIIDELTCYNPIKNKFYCIVAITSTLTPHVVTEFGATVIAGLNLEHKQACNLISDYDWDYMYKTFGCETEFVLPIIFNHKIANAFGSYQFYHDIIKNPVDRTPVNLITMEQMQNIVDRFNDI